MEGMHQGLQSQKTEKPKGVVLSLGPLITVLFYERMKLEEDLMHSNHRMDLCY